MAKKPYVIEFGTLAVEAETAEEARQIAIDVINKQGCVLPVRLVLDMSQEPDWKTKEQHNG